MFFSKSTANASSDNAVDGTNLTPEEIRELLTPILDPDIGVSIIELGLIYKIENHEGAIDVEMTFTTPACPYGPQLMEEVRYTLTSIEGIKSVNIDIVWEPPWSLENISEATRLEMGLDI